ncbi:MAG: thioesterase family protein [Verrucomicrobiae bacterium]|nr:thioesterase family protein [Verrucomicrobiae bacterium]
MEHPSFSTDIDVMFYDTDAGGVVHNIAYLRFIEFARTKLAARLDHDIRACAEKQIYAVVTRTEIDYLKPARLGETIVVTARLAGVDRARFYIESIITHKGDGRKLVACRQTLALVRLPEAKVQPVPEAWRALFAN